MDTPAHSYNDRLDDLKAEASSDDLAVLYCEIPTPLKRKLKAKAAMQGRPMREIVIDALRDKVVE